MELPTLLLELDESNLIINMIIGYFSSLNEMTLVLNSLEPETLGTHILKTKLLYYLKKRLEGVSYFSYLSTCNGS